MSLVLGVLLAHASYAAFVLPPQPLSTPRSAQQLDEAIDALHRLSWQLHAMAQTLPQAGGRSLAEDVDEWLLPPAQARRLEALRLQALAQSTRSDKAALRGTLKEATPLLGQEAYKAATLGAWWTFQDILARHESNLQALEARAPQEDHAARQSRIAMLAAGMRGQLPAALAADSAVTQAAAMQQLNEASETLLRAYNEERGKLAHLVSGAQHARGEVAPAQPRDTPCPETAAHTSGKAVPQIASDNAAPESLYPSTSRHAYFEGDVVVDASISAAGCMEKAAVYDSSGVAELDDAAIRWAQQAVFYPAERDHRPVDGMLRFRVRFQLSQ